MEATLRPHPDTPAPFVESFDVIVGRGPFGLSLEYSIRGDTCSIAVPDPAEPARRDALWRTTCFEAFIRGEAGEAYVEVNLSPSNEWAAYAFAGYRDGMRPLEEVPDPEIFALHDEGLLQLTGHVDLARVPSLSLYDTWHIGLSAVIEAADGSKSYWALKHPPGKPDFHHRDCFALELPPPNPA